MSPTATTRESKSTTSGPVLYVAFELSKEKWKLGFTTGLGQKPREKNIRARDRGAVLREFERTKKKFGLPADCSVKSCYEAGRDGFWLDRFLRSEGIDNIVVDSSSIEVNRKKKRAKTDRIDVAKLLLLLVRRDIGEAKALNSIRVPTVDEEDRRQLHREITTTQHELTRVTNRMKGLLANQGAEIDLKGDVPWQIEHMRLWDGSPLPPMLKARLGREWTRAEYLRDQLDDLEKERLAILREDEGEALDQVRKLMRLCGIAHKSSWLYVMEFFSWREFKNGKQVGALAGLAPTPYQSGEMHREHGICKAGNRHVRTMAVEIAWCWLKHQPNSKLTRWYYDRFGNGGPVAHKIGIVALARKLLVALWRYLEEDIVPEGAQLKDEYAC